MTFSPLVSQVVRTNKRSSRGGRKIERYIIHHTAGGTLASNLHTLATGPAKKSVNYILDTDGTFTGVVDEEYRAWTSGSASVDGNSVTVETINTTGAPRWEVSDAQLEAHAQMAADLARRHDWGKVDRSRVRGHREFAATECPGPYLYPRLDAIVSRANQILSGGAPSAATSRTESLTLDGGEPVNPVIYVADKTKGLLSAGALVYGGRAHALRDTKTRERLRDNGVPEVWFAPGGQQLNDFVNDLQKSGTRDSWPMLINVDGLVVYTAHGGFVELPKNAHRENTVTTIRAAFRDVETVHMPKWLYESVLNSVRSGNAP